METNTDAIRDGFLRQRRNLMVMTLVVFFTKYLGFDFDQFSIFGNVAKIEHPERVDALLWLGVLYWLIRYYQYAHELGNKGFRQKYYSRRRHLLMKKLHRKGVSVDMFIKLCELAGIARENGGRAKLEHIDVYRDGFGEMEIGLHYVMTPSVVGEFDKVEHEDRHYIILFFDLLGINTRAFVYMMTRTTYFTEYLLPYTLVIALIAYQFGGISAGN